jgi:transposase
MRKLRELLGQRLGLKLSVREIARRLGIGVGTVNRYLYRAQAAKVTSWPPGSGRRTPTERGRMWRVPRPCPVWV